MLICTSNIFLYAKKYGKNVDRYIVILSTDVRTDIYACNLGYYFIKVCPTIAFVYCIEFQFLRHSVKNSTIQSSIKCTVRFHRKYLIVDII